MLMFRHGLIATLLPILAGLAQSSAAEDAPKGVSSKPETKTIRFGGDIKMTRMAAEPAAAVNFTRELKLPFDGLLDLGVRIDRARRASDPVALRLAAMELGVAEQVSGKKTSITSEVLIKEAVDLAKIRQEPAELKALSVLSHNSDTKEQLLRLASQAEKRQEESATQAKSGEHSRGLQGTLRVFNNTDDRGTIYINGAYFGWINPKPDSLPNGAWSHDYSVNRPFEETTVVKIITSDGHVYQGYAENPKTFMSIIMEE